MALKSCRECGKEVSTEAKTCPHCGVANPAPGLRVGASAGAIGCLGILLLVGYCVANLPDTTPGTSPRSSASVSSRSAGTSSDVSLQAGDFKFQTGEFGETYLVGTVKNLTGKQYSYVQVSFNLYDGQGNQIGSTLTNVNDLEPYGTWKYKAIVMDAEKVRRARLKDVTGF